MIKAVFDIETNGLNPSVIWCIAAKVVGTWGEPEFFEPKDVHKFPQWLEDNNVEVLIGHNIINFDLPVIDKLLYYKWKAE